MARSCELPHYTLYPPVGRQSAENSVLNVLVARMWLAVVGSCVPTLIYHVQCVHAPSSNPDPAQSGGIPRGTSPAPNQLALCYSLHSRVRLLYARPKSGWVRIRADDIPVLVHGTERRHVRSIYEEGLCRSNRECVYLSIPTAERGREYSWGNSRLDESEVIYEQRDFDGDLEDHWTIK